MTARYRQDAGVTVSHRPLLRPDSVAARQGLEIFHPGLRAAF